MIKNTHAVTAYETPIIHSVIHENAFNDSANNLPPYRSRAVSYAYAESLFDHPSTDCIPTSTHSSGKKAHFWRSKTLTRKDSLYEKPAGDVRVLILQLKQAEIKKISRNDIRCSIILHLYLCSYFTCCFI